MKIPIQREDTGAEVYSPFRETKQSSSSTYTEKKSVRITPKVTEIEIKHADKVFKPEAKPVPIYTTHETRGNKGFPSSKSPGIDEFSALKVFDPKIRRWMRHDLDDLFLPSHNHSNGHNSLIRDKFDDLTAKMMTPAMNMTMGGLLKDHPIKVETFVAEKDQYVLTLNVQQFKPEELEVKITDDTISITGKHEERQDEQNFSVQEYSRKHTLPPGVTADDVRCKFSSGGVLTISAPRKDHPSAHHWERTIPIQHQGMPAIRV